MTIDRDTLERAARAVGIVGEWVEDSLEDEYYKLPTTGIKTVSQGRVHIWNADTSSGDALRLAVALGTHSTNSDTAAWASTHNGCAIMSAGTGPLAATRKAIVLIIAAEECYIKEQKIK